jgi:hypothetical protein
MADSCSEKSVFVGEPGEERKDVPCTPPEESTTATTDEGKLKKKPFMWKFRSSKGFIVSVVAMSVFTVSFLGKKFQGVTSWQS